MNAVTQSWLKHARSIVSDLFERKAWIYWADCFTSLFIGYTAALIFLKVPVAWWVQILAYFVAVVALYRASSFMHEISHMKRGEMKGFKLAWNLLAGIPMLVPSFFYEPHLEHHSTRHYGTDHDGEYLPLGHGSKWKIVGFIAQIFYLPLLTVVRFLFITPLSFVIPGFRDWALRHWSSFVINLRYSREITDKDPVRQWTIIEILCSLRAWAIPGFVLVGIDAWYIPFMLYSLAIGIIGLNHLRTLAAHRYRSDGEPMDRQSQLLDSTDIVGDPVFTEIVCPVGLRFHALHHLFPGIPYHNLRAAHLRLMKELPADSPYRQCVYPSYFHVIGELLGENRRPMERQTAQGQSGGKMCRNMRST